MSPLEFPDWDQQWTPPATDAEYEAAYMEALEIERARVLELRRQRVRQRVAAAAYDARPWWKKSPEDWPALARWVWERVR